MEVMAQEELELHNPAFKGLCTVSRLNPYCPSARFSLDSHFAILKEGIGWSVVSTHNHRRVLVDQKKGVATFELKDIEVTLSTFKEEDDNIWIVGKVQDKGNFFILTRNGEIANEVHTEQEETNKGVASFYRHLSITDGLIGRVVFSDGFQVDITKSILDQILSYKPEAVMEGRIPSRRISFPYGLSVDGLIHNLSIATVHLEFKDDLANILTAMGSEQRSEEFSSKEL